MKTFCKAEVGMYHAAPRSQRQRCQTADVVCGYYRWSDDMVMYKAV